MLPYLVDRPQVLHRHVDGHMGKEFFQRISRKCPPWAKIARITLDGGAKTRDFHLCQDWPTLLWLANFGCIELIPWGSRVGSLDRPDLDPDRVPFERVIETALVVRKILDQTGAEGFCKTSGKRGLHVYIPFGQARTHGYRLGSRPSQPEQQEPPQ
jgi:bifunctional non-homologous end joining protein LigD